MKIGGPLPPLIPPSPRQELPSSQGSDWLGGRCGFGQEEPAIFDLKAPVLPGLGRHRGAVPPGPDVTPRCPEPGPDKPMQAPPVPAPVPLLVETPAPPLPETPCAPGGPPGDPPVQRLPDAPPLPKPGRPPVGTVDQPPPDGKHLPGTIPLKPEQPRVAVKDVRGDPSRPPVRPRAGPEGPPSQRDIPAPLRPGVSAEAPAPRNPHRPATPAGPDDKPLPDAPEAAPVKGAKPGQPPRPVTAQAQAPQESGEGTPEPGFAATMELSDRLGASREPIAADAPGPRVRQNASRFDELGMFGLHDRAVAPEMPAAPSPELPVQPAAEAPQPDAALLPAALQTTSSLQRLPGAPPLPRPARSDLAAGVKQEARGARPKPSAGPANLDVPEIALSSGDLEQPSETQTDLAEPSAPPEPVRDDAAGTSLHDVVIAERSGQLYVAAAAPPLDGDGRALLRRLVRDILAGRSLRLEDFQLNGVPLGTDFQDITGGSNGPGAR
jgi:hypothetical protein